MGPKAWKGGYSVLSLIGFVLIVYGYGLARQTPIVSVHAACMDSALGPAFLTIAAFMLIAAAYVPETRIKRTVGHPMVARRQGLGLRASAGERRRGRRDAVRIILVWAMFNYTAALPARSCGGNVVYAVGPMSRDVAAVAIGAVAWAVFAFWLHGWLIGVRARLVNCSV